MRLWLLLVMLAVTACGGTASPSPAPYRDVDPAQLQTMLQHKDFVLVDVHIPHEGYLAETDVRIPYNEVERNLDKLPQDRSASIVLYCMSGRMSDIAGRKLAELGYTNLYNLKGGMAAWREQGLPLLPQ